MVKLAKEKKRAIALENLKRVPRGKRGDGAAKLRKRLQQFIYRRLLERIEVLVRRNGVEVIRVLAAWSSVIGALKYAPQCGLDKDRAAALVIARRGLGLWDKIPKNYRNLLDDREYLQYALFRWKALREELDGRLEAESNPWKKNCLRGDQKSES